MILWQQYKGLIKETRDTGFRGFKNYPKLHDVIYEQPQCRSKSAAVKMSKSLTAPLKADRLSSDATPNCYLVDKQTTECGHTLEVIMNNMKPCFDQKLLKVNL